MKIKTHKFVNMLAVFDKAVVYGFLYRGFQAGAGLINLLFLTYFFTLELQGFYYTFSSLMALQTFLELGLYLVIVAFVSHNWSGLKIDAQNAVCGDPKQIARLKYLLGFIGRWYGIGAFISIFIIGSAGYFFLQQVDGSNVKWQSPWVALVTLASLQFFLTPFLYFLEGCNQVGSVNKFRFFQVLLETICAWLFFLMHLELWVVVAIQLARVITTLWFLIITYKSFFLSILQVKQKEKILWKSQIWPMQWRLAIQGVFNYLINTSFVPIMFYFHGPELAGKMGMTIQLITTIMTLSLIWIQTKIPRLGILVSQNRFVELDGIWFRFSIISFISATFMGVILITILYYSNYYWIDLSRRVLEINLIIIFFVSYLLVQIPQYQSIYLRAFAREAFLLEGVISGTFLGLGLVIFGGIYEAMGAAYCHLAVTILISVPLAHWIWVKKKRQWCEEMVLNKKIP